MRAPELEEPGRSQVFLKLENLQITGSFKVRGAANRILSLSPKPSGNGESSPAPAETMAGPWPIMAGTLGIPAVICVPDWVDPVKLAGMEKAGAQVVLSGDSYDEAEARALDSGRRGGPSLHPTLRRSLGRGRAGDPGPRAPGSRSRLWIR